MIRVKFWQHSRNIKASFGCMTLHLSENFLRPMKLMIISDNNEALSLVSYGLNSTVNKDIYAFTAVILSPRRIGVETIIVGYVARKAI